MLKCKVCRYLLIFLCLLFANNVFAIDSWPELKAQIETKYKGFSTEIKDMEMLMEVEAKGIEEAGPSEIKMFMKGEKYRVETKVNFPEGSGMPAMTGMETIIIFDGKDLWTVNPITGKQKLPTEAKVSDKNQMNWWKDLPEKGKIVGSEKIGERNCYVVEAENEDSSKIKGWIDKQELLLVKIEQEANEGEKIIVLNSNFKKVKNWEIPYTTEVSAGEKVMSKSNIKSLEIDKGLSDDLFDVEKIKVEGQINIQDMMKKFKIGG